MSHVCPVCEAENVLIGEQRSSAPVLMNKPYRSRADARAALVGELEIAHCQDCGFTWNTRFDPN